MTKIVYFLPMARIVIVAFEGAQTLDVTGPAEVFAATNRELKTAAYQIVLTALGLQRIAMSSGIVASVRDLRRVRPESRDTVIVVGGEEAYVASAARDETLLRWVRRANGKVQRMASVCAGAFVLAAAGILDGLRATTHWSACDRLAQFRPQITVDRNAVFVREGSLWTSAGVTTGIDMALAMVEEDHGRAVADAVAGRLVLFVRRPGFQSQFSDALVAQSAGSDPLGSVVAWARAHLRDADIERLARQAGLSVRTFHRRCLAHLGTTPAKLLDKLRVEHARTLLATTEMPTKALVATCGFGSAAQMKRAFARELGMAPRDYKLLHA
ncbi:MAG TPA: DJ-1/PfpI family protein [Polyangiaceae bacterium]|jgi:transcriptional regulator GlxA family with amidase domain|nr:DJ-1/PfpI family protein [Polyangiaceae bacterium]